MENISSQYLTELCFEEKNGISRKNEAIRVGVPLPKGKYHEGQLFGVISLGKEIESQFKITARWTDGSLRWVLFSFFLSLEPFQKQLYQIVCLQKIPEIEQFTKVEDSIIECKFGDIQKLNISRNGQFVPFSFIKNRDNKDRIDYNWDFFCVDNSDNLYRSKITSSQIEETGKILTVIQFVGIFQNENSELLDFTSRLYIYHTTQIVRCDICIRNSHASEHIGNFWDLGDSGSIFFKEISLRFNVADHFQSIYYKETPSGTFKESNTPKEITILQQSSGGENWISKNHINYKREIHRIVSGGFIKDGKECIHVNRIQPSLSMHGKGQKISIGIKKFWQNFPKAISSDEKGILISLFPSQNNECYELQGGESKTHTLYFCFDEQTLDWISHPLNAKYDPQWIKECNVYEYFSIPTEKDNKRYFDYVNNIVNGSNTFFLRREIIDEYGWRNFGDFFADHESRYNQKNEPFISHYNNQYDGLYWCLIHYLRGGNQNWFELANDLAYHIIDIDIYNTKLDRFEFNGGIFWHTNHYFDAGTSTHRCYSKAHTKKNTVTPSGGPSPQNCYTRGLMLHYYLTGESYVLEALRNVCQNINTLVSGPESLVDKFIYRLKISLKKIRKQYAKYPEPYNLFEGPARESANALMTLCNGFVAFSDLSYLKNAEKLIRECVSPNENLEKRDLTNAEMRWNYVMFLQSLAYYLNVKENFDKKDSLYAYAKNTFLYYARWMLKNEKRYLSDSQKLEFPNETWGAQELRKAEVFYIASFLSDTKSEQMQFQKNGDIFYKAAFDDMESFGEFRFLTRPLIIALGNGLLREYVN